LFASLSLSVAAPFAVYTLNAGSPNYLHIFAGDNTGNVTFSGQVSTGGNGESVGVQSQGCLCTLGSYILAVNSLSNTLSLLWANQTDPTMVTLVATASTGGDWPLSVTATANANVNIACVVTSGVSNILRCFTFNTTGLWIVAGSDRTLGLVLTNPPLTHTGPGEVSFLPSGKGVAISIKTATPPIMVYSVDPTGMTGAVPTVSPVLGNVPFAFVFDTDGSIVLVDAAANGVYSGIIDMTVNASLSISLLTPGYFIIPNQKAACWISWATGGEFFAANAGTMNISVLTRSGTTFTVVTTIPIGFGITDNVVGSVNGSPFLYQLSGAAKSIFVISVATNAVVAVAPTPAGASMNGMIFVSASVSPSSPSSTAMSSSTGTVMSSSTGSSGSSTVVPSAVVALALCLLALVFGAQQ